MLLCALGLMSVLLFVMFDHPSSRDRVPYDDVSCLHPVPHDDRIKFALLYWGQILCGHPVLCDAPPNIRYRPPLNSGDKDGRTDAISSPSGDDDEIGGGKEGKDGGNAISRLGKFAGRISDRHISLHCYRTAALIIL